VADPGAAILRCRLTITPAGITLATADWILFFAPVTKSPSPRIMASNPALATSAASSLAFVPTLASQPYRLVQSAAEPELSLQH
jgi:hypothetical protein